MVTKTLNQYCLYFAYSHIKYKLIIVRIAITMKATTVYFLQRRSLILMTAGCYNIIAKLLMICAITLCYHLSHFYKIIALLWGYLLLTN